MPALRGVLPRILGDHIFMTHRISRRALAALPLLALALSSCAAQVEPPAGAVQPPIEAAATTTGDTPWGFPVYDIPADPAVRYGVLANGMKYAVLHNETPQKTVAVRFGFDVGWVDENATELGLAHFIEHMAFNGSTSVPEGEMIKLLEREGLAFGADTNASTGFEETIYKLDLPRNDPALLGTALMLMRETASELTIAPEAVGRERGVIQSETRTRNNFGIRRIKDYLQFAAPGTRFATRFRADGTEEVIGGASAEAMRALYARFYRPDNATLVVVGDIDPATVEAEIRERFAGWTTPTAQIPDTAKGKIDLARGPAAANFVDPDVPYIVTIDRFAAYVERRDTIEEFRDTLLLNLGTAMLNRRFEKLALAADAPIISGGASASDFFDVARQSSLTLQAKEGEWEEALAIGEQELRRAVMHGFTEGELAEQLANFALRFRTAAEQAATRRSAGLAEAILGTVQDEDLFINPQVQQELFERMKSELAVEAVDAAFTAHYALADPLIHVSTKQPIEGGAAAILAAYDTSTEVAVAPPVETAGETFAYTDFGSPGMVVSDTQVADLGFRQIRFANNVRLNLKTTDFEDGKVRYLVRLGSGQLALPKDAGAEAIFLSAVGSAGGLGKHSFDQLQRMLAGRDVSYGIAVGEDSFSMSGTTTMADLPLQMKVSTAYVSDPGYRPEALSRWNALIPPFLAQTDATPQAVATFEVPSIVANGDRRFGIPSEAELESVTLDGVEALFSPQLAQAPIEISVVGDIDEAAVIEAVANSFGALPLRAKTLAAFLEAREASFAADTDPVTLYHAGAPDQALAQVYWPTTDDSDAQLEATTDLLAKVLELELLEVVREKLGATYSPSAGSSMSDVFDDYGTLSTSIIVEPEQADAVYAAVDAITDKLREAPVSDDLLARARKPLLERIALNRRENGYWLGVLSEAQLEPERLDRVRSLEERIRAVTPAMLQAAARRFLTDDREFKIRIVHKSLKPE